MKRHLYRWLKGQRLRPRDKFILQKLCDYADDTSFEAGVRVADLAEDVGCCERTIQAGLRLLEADGFIADTGRTKRLRSGGTPRIYRVAPELLIQGAEAAAQQRGVLRPTGRNLLHPYKEPGTSLSKESLSSAGPASLLPASIRKLFVDYLGEGFGTAYLDRCEWNGADRTLLPHSGHSYKRVRFEGGRVLNELKITVLKPGL